MQHIEFIHTAHFEKKYHRRWVRQGSLQPFIEFFWETDFEELWSRYPQGFSDLLFPNTGYTYLINLGTPFVMQLGDEGVEMRSDGFLPRHKSLVCHHATGNKIFGIKFNISPLVFQKRINFSEYRDYIFPLAYLIDREVVLKIKCAPSFSARVEIISAYYKKIIEQYRGSLQYVDIVASILKDSAASNAFTRPIEDWAAQYGITSRTLQRYFEAATSTSSKQALQIMRIRKAVQHLTTDAPSFHFSQYGYYDYSHFYKHLKAFLDKHFTPVMQPHLRQLQHLSPT
jgi:AraC-like DNA-binding protein